jgi:U32 family peptidase
MKIISTLHNIKSIQKMTEFCDGFIVGNQDFGTRLTQSFTIDEINDIATLTQKHNSLLFILANQMMTDDYLESFKSFVKELPIPFIKGIVVADIGAVMVLKSLELGHLAIYHPETLHTNYYDFNFLETEGILGAFVAKEITLADIKMIAHHKKHSLFMVGHGHLNMFYSKRQLIDNFTLFAGLENNFHAQQNLKIIEENREDAPYPILEDQAGTHVFRHEVFTSLAHIDVLKSSVDYLIIDTLFKDDAYALKVLPLYYEHMVHSHELIDHIKKHYHEVWDDGFLYKKTIYKKTQDDDL